MTEGTSLYGVGLAPRLCDLDARLGSFFSFFLLTKVKLETTPVTFLSWQLARMYAPLLGLKLKITCREIYGEVLVTGERGGGGK